MARFESEQRERILDAAIRVFARSGFKGATVRTVGREARVNSALIYYYFENKDRLFEEALLCVIQGFLDLLRKHRAEFRSGRDRVAYLVHGLLEYYSVYPERIRLLAVTVSLYGEHFSRTIATLLRRGIPLPIDVLIQGMAEGQLRSMHPIMMWWSIIGICLHNLLIHDAASRMDLPAITLPSDSLEEREERIVDLLLHGLEPNDNPKNTQPGSDRT